MVVARSGAFEVRGACFVPLPWIEAGLGHWPGDQWGCVGLGNHSQTSFQLKLSSHGTDTMIKGSWLFVRE